jgi:hypothetical protein
MREKQDMKTIVDKDGYLGGILTSGYADVFGVDSSDDVGIAIKGLNNSAGNSSEPTSIPKRSAAFSQASTATFGP